LAVGAEETAAGLADVVLGLYAGEAFASDHGLARFGEAFQEFGRDDPFGRVRRRELEADREPVGRPEEIEPERTWTGWAVATDNVETDARDA